MCSRRTPDASTRSSGSGATPSAARCRRLRRAGTARRLAEAGRQGLDALLAVLLAPGCAVCETPLDAPTRGPVCAACWRTVPRITPPVCDGCGDPLPVGTTDAPAGGRGQDADQGAPAGTTDAPPARCRRCRRPRALIPRRRAAGPYEGALRRLVHAFKYEQRHGLAPSLGRLMRQSGAEMLAGADCVVAVPLHPRRQRARGFNQAAELAARLGPPVVGALRRTRATAPQADLPAGQRRRNVRGAFAPARRLGTRSRRAAVEGACVVLVDDVTTTGATLDACARVLRRAGAREVRALTLARVVRRERP